MSIAIGDVIALATLAFNLYHDGFGATRGAPVEFKLLVDDLQSLHGMMLIFKEELKNPESVLVRSGEDRERMFVNVLGTLKQTLEELNKAFDKHRNLGSTAQSRLRRGWDKFKWAIDAKDIDALRARLSYNNGVLSLLLTCINNSSVQRLEAVTNSISNGVSELKGFLEHACTGYLPESVGSSSTNTQSIVGATLGTFGSGPHGIAGMKFIEKCGKAAEVRQRWMTIGIQEWIHAGRWWFLKAKMGLRMIKTPGDNLTPELFGELLKASWIICDIISMHPQLGSVDLSVRYEVLRLTEAINTEFQYLQTLQVKLPHMEAISNVTIWEGYVESSGVQVEQMLQAQVKDQAAWESSNDFTLFHCYAYFGIEGHHSMLPVMVMVLINTESMQARLVIHDQGWRCLLEISLNQKSPNSRKDPLLDHNTIFVSGATIIFATLEIARHLYSILRFYMELSSIVYANESETFFKKICTHCAFIILTNMRLPNRDLFGNLQYILLLDQYRPEILSNIADDSSDQSQTSALEFLASVRKRAENATYAYDTQPDRSKTWLDWILSQGYTEIAEILLRGRGLPDQLVGFCVPPSGRQRSRFSSAWSADDAGGHAIVNQHLLFTAIQARDFKITKFLLDSGVDVKGQLFDGDNYPVLYHVTSKEIVELLIERGADLEGKITPSTRPHSQTWVGAPLNHHVRNNNPTMVEYLLQAGADPNNPGKNNKNLTPLHYAALSRHSDMDALQTIVDCLIQYGAAPNPICSLGNTPLHYAARGPHPTILRQLLGHGANVKSANRDSYTAIYDAAALANAQMIKVLLEYGSDVDGHDENLTGEGTSILWAAVNRAGSHPLEIANSILESLDLLISRGAKIDAGAGSKLETALHRAAQLSLAKIAEFLIDKGADIESKDIKSRTPLHLAVRNAPNTNTTILLLQRRASPNVVDCKGRTPLHYIHMRESLSLFACDEITSLLVDSGANINAKDHLGRTALHYPIDRRVHRLLLRHGADVHVQDKNLQTPLNFLLTHARCRLEDVKQLYIHGADLATVDVSLKTPLHYATDSRIVKYLLENGAGDGIEACDWEGCTPLHVAARNGQLEKLKALLRAGADITAKDYHKRTPFHYAVLHSHPYDAAVEASRLLQELGADINCRDETQCTPLHCAIMKGSMRVAIFLMDCGADVNARESRGYTPLHCAIKCAMCFSEGQEDGQGLFVNTLDDVLEVVQALIEKAVEISAKDNEGRTAEDILSTWNCQDEEEKTIKNDLQKMLRRR